MCCKHYLREYLSLKDHVLRFQCLDECMELIPIGIAADREEWLKQEKAALFFSCECTPHGWPSFDVEEDDDYYVLHCYHCPHPWARLPKDDPDYQIFVKNEWGKRQAVVKVTNLRQLSPADHVIFNRTTYEHHAIVIEVDLVQQTFTVCHYSTEENYRNSLAKVSSALWSADCCNKLEVCKFFDFTDVLSKVHYLPLDVNPREESYFRAIDALGKIMYNLLTNNCEHFVTRLKTDRSISQQVNRVLKWFSIKR